MGYIILGIIILLLLTVFMNDLYRSYREGDEDKSYRAYRGQAYQSEFSDEFDFEEDLDDTIEDEPETISEEEANDTLWTHVGLGGTTFPDQINQQNLLFTEFAEEFSEETDEDEYYDEVEEPEAEDPENLRR